MAVRKPIVHVNGDFQQVQGGDLVDALTLASHDAWNLLLNVGSDGALFYNGQLVASAIDVGDTVPVPATGASAKTMAYSTLLGCIVYWNGASWQQASSATNNVTVNEATGTEAGFKAAITKALSYNMAAGKTVTIQLALGTYTLTDNAFYSWSEVDFSKIKIQGSTPPTATISAIYSVSLISGKQYSVVLTLNSVNYLTAGGYLIVKPTGGGAYWASLHGCWPITSVDAGNSRVTITVTTPTAFAPATGAATGNVVGLNTVLNVATGFAWEDCQICGLSNLCVTQNGTTANISAITLSGGATFAIVNNVGIYGWSQTGSNGLNIIRGARAELNGVAIGGCTTGMIVDDGTNVTALVYIGGSGAGFSAANIGIQVNHGAVLTLNGSSGAVGGAYGIYANVGSRVRITSDTSYNLTSNSTDGIIAWNLSTVDAIGYIANVTCSPAKNTYGNNNSTIFA